ncbi:MAG: 3-hydroxybenzoate 6-monooxygenase [Rhodospirillales bacterium]|nr:3-hydroxybenzoate 6-monooxygenase [Rhodospirillales bacterium]
MPNNEKHPIVIIGGGIGGCAASLALSKKGYKSIVIEKSRVFSEIGAGIQLGPNVHKMFVKLGLDQAIQDIAFYPDNIFMKDGITGELITKIVTGKDFQLRFNGPYGVIHRGDLLEVIVDACKKSDLIELRTSTEIIDYEETKTGIVAITSDQEKIFGSALVAADGIWSKTRSNIVNDGDPIISGHIAYRAVLPISEVPEFSQDNDVVLWAGPKFHLVHYKLRRGELFNIVAVFHSDRYEEGWDAFGDPEELQIRFKNATADVQSLLGKIDSWKMWVLCDREPVRNWSKNRVTLLGDSAHPTLQYLAAGAGMAIEDAVVLADCLSQNKQNYEEAFIQYQETRYLRTAQVQTTARLYGQLYHASDVVGELRTNMLKNKDPYNYEGIAWLYDGI